MGKKLRDKAATRKAGTQGLVAGTKFHLREAHNEKNGIFALHERRKRVCELYVRGYSQWEIAKEIKVEQSVVHQDLEAIHSIWQERMVQSFDEHKRRELAKVDEIERLAYAEYARSQKPERTKTTYEEEVGDLTKSGKRTQVKGRLGDSRYLDTLKWCIEMRCKILSITKESKVQVNNLMALSWDEIANTTSTGDTIEQEILQLEGLTSDNNRVEEATSKEGDVR